MKKNVLTAVVSVAMVGCLAVGGTLAYLTAQSGTVTNNFTGSNALDVKINESAVDGDTYDLDSTNEFAQDGSAVAGDDHTSTSIKYINVVPFAEVDKNVAATVTVNPTDSYLYVKVSVPENITVDMVTTQVAGNWWNLVDSTNGIYVLMEGADKAVVDSSEQDKTYTVFTTASVGDFTDGGASLGDITVKAATIQANGLVDDNGDALSETAILAELTF